MTIKEIKDIMKSVNEPNEFSLVPVDLSHPKYWIWECSGIKLKQISDSVIGIRRDSDRWDIYINGQYISKDDYLFLQKKTGLTIKFIRTKFPSQFVNGDLAGTPYQIFSHWQVKIKGDLEVIT